MPPESQLSHRNIRSSALPYASLVSPTNTEPAYVSGSQDILTSIKGYAERRPGFANVDATGFTNLARVFTWDRFDGQFLKMFCDTAAGISSVSKQVIGVDTAPVFLFSDTTSNTPFDFAVSNNTVYMGNGHVMKKYDPVNGLSSMGIAIGSVNAATGPDTAGTGTSPSGGGPVWSNPGNVNNVLTSYATNTSSLTSGTTGTTGALQGTNYGFSIASTTVITGISLTFNLGVTVTGGGVGFNVYTTTVTMLKAGTIVGTAKTTSATPPGTPGSFSFGGSSDLWGTTWTPSDINNSNFGFQITVQVRNQGNVTRTYTFSSNAFQITVYGLGGPAISVSGSAGTFSAVTGYQYVFCYGNSNTGHVSSPTPPSASTGTFTSKLNVQVSLTASTDPQVNQIRVFRSTDSVAAGGAAANYFELPTSPYPNTTANITDNTADANLLVANIAPTFGFNDPPTPSRGLTYFSGRFWSFSGNKVFFSALEECIIGVPEESWPSGVAGNFWAFDQPIQGLAVAGSADNQCLLVFAGGRIYGIVGTTLDTFRRFTITQRRGCRRLETITTMGGMVAWLDSAMQIWATDGTTTQEIGLPIRPDLANLNPANCSMTFHSAGTAHWLVFSSGQQLFVYDLDTEQFMPPWSVALQYVFSGETAPGSYQLFGAQPTTSLTLSTVNHNDNGSFYTPIGKTSLMALVPDFGTRFSLSAMGVFDEPSRSGYPAIYQIDTNTAPLTDFLFMADDDPLNANTTYTSIFANLQPPSTAFNRGQGLYLVQNIFVTTQPTSRWISIEWKGATAEDSLKVFGWYLAYKQFR